MACPSYASEKNPNDVGWTTLYRLPSRECLYKVAWSGYTREKKQLMLLTTSISIFDDICLAVGFVRFICFFWFPVNEIDDIPAKFERGPLNFIQNHVDVSIDVIKNTIDITTIAV